MKQEIELRTSKQCGDGNNRGTVNVAAAAEWLSAIRERYRLLHNAGSVVSDYGYRRLRTLLTNRK